MIALTLYLAAILLPAGVLYAVIVKRHFDVCSFYIFGHLLLFVPAALLMGFGMRSGDPNPFLVNIDFGQALSMQGLIFALHGFGLAGGYLLFARTGLGRAALPYFSENRSNMMTMIGLVVLTLINAAIIAGPLFQSGSLLGAVFLIRNEFYFSGVNYLRVFLVVGTFLCAAHFAHMLRHRKAERFSGIAIVFVGALFVLNLLFSAALGGKGFIIYPFIFFLLALYARQLYRRIGMLIMLFMVFITAVVGLQQIRVEMVNDNQNLSSWDYAYTGLRFRLFEDNLVYLGSAGKLHETEMGEDFVNGTLGPVPRSLWPQKPDEITAGARFKRQLMPQSSGGWPPYGMNQWYMNFGWLGVIVGGVVTGLLLQALQCVYVDYQTNTYSFVIMMVFLVRFLINGGIDNMFLVEYVFYILPLFIFARLTDKRLYRTDHEGPKTAIACPK